VLNYIYMRRNRETYPGAADNVVMVFHDLQGRRRSRSRFVGELIAMAGYELRGRLDVSNCTTDLDGVKDSYRGWTAPDTSCDPLDEFEAISGTRISV